MLPDVGTATRKNLFENSTMKLANNLKFATRRFCFDQCFDRFDLRRARYVIHASDAELLLLRSRVAKGDVSATSN
jgi:hypothetical protein